MVLSGKKRLLVGTIVLALLLTAVSGFAVSAMDTSDGADRATREPMISQEESEWTKSTEWVEETTWVEPSTSESVMWTEVVETEAETQVYETFLSEPYVVMPSDVG